MSEGLNLSQTSLPLSLPLPLPLLKDTWQVKAKSVLKFLGPAFIVSVAYIDPGNFATNISGGSVFNYDLIWVILWSNLMAIFLQSMSAKLGIATGHNLPEMCSKHSPVKLTGFSGLRLNSQLWPPI